MKYKKAALKGISNGVILSMILIMQIFVYWENHNSPFMDYIGLALIVVITTCLCSNKNLKLFAVSFIICSAIFITMLITAYFTWGKIYESIYKIDLESLGGSDGGEALFIIFDFISFTIGFLIALTCSVIRQHFGNKKSDNLKLMDN